MSSTAVRHVLVEYIILRHREESLYSFGNEIRELIRNVLAHRNDIRKFRRSLSRIVQTLVAKVYETDAPFAIIRNQLMMDRFELAKNRDELLEIAVEEITLILSESEKRRNQQIHNAIFEKLRAMSEKDLSITTVESLADSLKYSRNHFSIIAKYVTGKKPNLLIREEKLRRAILLLSDHKSFHTISEIADRLGFSNPKYFGIIFKQAFGFSPTQLPSRTKTHSSIQQDSNY